jgi:hypothetical protein
MDAASKSQMLIREYPNRVVSGNTTYIARICGEERVDSTWEGWIEFHPSGGGAVFVTDQETSQPNRVALEYWADGLEPLYLDGAFARAEGRLL